MHTLAKKLIRDKIKSISAENRELREKLKSTLGVEQRSTISRVMKENQKQLDELLISLEVLNGGTLG